MATIYVRSPRRLDVLLNQMKKLAEEIVDLPPEQKQRGEIAGWRITGTDGSSIAILWDGPQDLRRPERNPGYSGGTIAD